jgi:hypothetical protein
MDSFGRTSTIYFHKYMQAWPVHHHRGTQKSLRLWRFGPIAKTFSSFHTCLIEVVDDNTKLIGSLLPGCIECQEGEKVHKNASKNGLYAVHLNIS